MRLAVVTNPGSRRARLFAAAVRAAGLPPPVEIAWRDVAAGHIRELEPGTLLRIDAPDGDGEVDRLLRGASRAAEHGEVTAGAAWYRGFVSALGRLAASGATPLNDPADIAVLFDKRRCHSRLAAAAVQVPPALPGVDGYAALREGMHAAGWDRVFVKPAHGSSASGVIALATAGDRLVATTPVEMAGGRLFNSLRVRRYTDERVLASIVDRLAPGGLHVERWFTKAAHGGRTVDVRVVVVAGEPTHAVVRASRHPMTNLHLGARRGDLAAVEREAGPTAWADAMDTCRRAAAAFPGCLQVGVDLMFAPGWRRHAVAEVNAFGDLLPGLRNAAGRDTYQEQVHALVTRESACST
jgi:glutathione synthase/RimK-type ligase-like ATP-grasp enzyme